MTQPINDLDRRVTVMEVQMVKKYEGLRMDQVITFKGKLKLNVDDIYQLNYILEDAEIIE